MNRRSLYTSKQAHNLRSWTISCLTASTASRISGEADEGIATKAVLASSLKIKDRPKAPTHIGGRLKTA